MLSGKNWRTTHTADAVLQQFVLDLTAVADLVRVLAEAHSDAPCQLV